MSIFQPASSSGVATRPMPNLLCARTDAVEAITPITAIINKSRQRIGHLTVRRNPPRPDRVVVVNGIFAAHRDQLCQCRLDITGFLSCPALNRGGVTFPLPGQAEAGQRPRQDRVLQLRPLPALAVVD